MYEKGLVKMISRKDSIFDHREDFDNEEKTPPCAFLPHSCEEWVIGGPKEVQMMISDLCVVFKKMSK